MAGALLAASQKIARDVRGTPSAPEASGPHAEPVRLVTTDLGSIEHIIGGGGLVQNVTERVSTALTKATDSIRGPHGGLIPSSVQNTMGAGLTRVEGQAEALYHAATVGSGHGFGDRVRAQVAVVRARLKL
jgi:hypothetical protein